MPLTAADAAILAAEPYNVCAVVNMCAEWPGPQKAYAKLGIVQCRLPFQDTSAPSAEALRRGAAFVRAQLEAQPGKRVFIHCKGGIARASAMSLAHYVLNRGHDVDDAIEEIKRKRPIVMRDAAKYASVLELTRDAARPPPQ
ncbi:protein-tyrosine phosphatase-like protein [Pelagophyceae sp. CCMP2097]|nr:protein-tyrosine phosphatase-like protein [Pelagophyceae sp. CCMP2097]